jgi:hypothetical protein
MKGLQFSNFPNAKCVAGFYVAPTSCGRYSLGLFPWIIARVSFSFARFSIGAFILFNNSFSGSAMATNRSQLLT